MQKSLPAPEALHSITQEYCKHLLPKLVLQRLETFQASRERNRNHEIQAQIRVSTGPVVIRIVSSEEKRPRRLMIEKQESDNILLIEETR